MSTGIGLILYLLSITSPNYPQNLSQSSETAVLGDKMVLKPDFMAKNGTSGVFLRNLENEVVLNVPFIHQIDNLTEETKKQIGTTACGPASIAMLLNFYGNKITLNEVINMLPNSVYVKGKMFYNLYDGGKYFDKETVKVKNSYKNIFETLKEGKPLIMNIQNYDGITGHAVVVVGIKAFDGEKAEALIVHDPYVGAYREFKYINEKILKQPEGYNNYIGTLDPFYFREKSDELASK